MADEVAQAIANVATVATQASAPTNVLDKQAVQSKIGKALVLHPKVAASSLAMLLVNLVAQELKVRFNIELLDSEMGLLTLVSGFVAGYLAPVLPTLPV